MAAVEVRRLAVSFDRSGASVAAVRDTTFSVFQGESFGLVGPSGCGKSTVLRVIAGLQRDWTGRVAVHGTELVPRARMTGQLRRDIQMVFQDPYASLHPRHRISRALGEPLQVNGESQVKERVAEVLSQVGLDPTMARRYPHELSGGQRQRVAIARALLLRPKLLLLDEPTSALDVSVQAEILNLLSDLKVTHGMTLILVSHDPDVIAHMCSRAVRMADGAIQEVLDRTRLSHYA
ncbi:ABC transporter ATP-binding protein [Microvirga sp. BT350]|uniref:Glutathione import ATP-binding protein GsiA n=1 Tax=Microvirga alba TaxID=2791025 RepID=A0A931BMP3_9HYPH|nr:ABC transporter ATP-binding protein [Microvirga alba]